MKIIRITGYTGAYSIALFFLLCLLIGLAKYTLPQAPIVLLFSAFMVGMIMYMRRQGMPNVSNNCFWTCAVILLVGTFLTEAYVVNCLPFEWATDPRLCREQAIYMQTTWEVKPELKGYFGMYPHNINVLIVLGGLYRLLGDYTNVIYVFLLWVNISSLLSCLTVRNLTGSNGISLFTLLLLQVFCIFTTRTYMPYTSNLALLFPILLVYIYTTKISTTKKAILIPLLAALGWQAKLTSLIAFIAIAIIELLRYVLNRKIYTKKDIVIAILSAIMSFALCAGVKTILWNDFNYQRDDNREKGFAYFLYLGQNTQSGGQWDAEYVQKSEYLAPKIERDAYYYSVAKHDFTERGLLGNLKFYIAKTTICWGCTYMDYTKFTGKKYDWIFTLRHSIWFFTFFCAMLLVFLCRNKYILAMMLTLTGVMVYLFLSEGSFTYVIMFSPLVFTMAGITFAKLCIKSV